MRTPNFKEGRLIELEEMSFTAKNAAAGIIVAAISYGLQIAAHAITASQQQPPQNKFGGIACLHQEEGEIITLPDRGKIIPNHIAEGIAKSDKINLKLGPIDIRKVQSWFKMEGDK